MAHVQPNRQPAARESFSWLLPLKASAFIAIGMMLLGNVLDAGGTSKESLLAYLASGLVLGLAFSLAFRQQGWRDRALMALGAMLGGVAASLGVWLAIALVL